MNAVRHTTRVLGAAAAATILVASWGPSRTDADVSAAVPASAAIASPALASAAAVRVPISPPRFVATAGADTPVLATPSNWRTPSSATTRVVLVGDSLALESSQLVAFFTAPKVFVSKFWGGTAPCDWVDVDLEVDPTTVVVISFTGNSLTACMSNGAGGFLEHEALAARYRADVETLVDRARQAGARVVLVGQAQHAASYNDQYKVDAINGMFQEFAASWAHVSFVDAGAAVETPNGEYADRLPCTQFDDDCAADGTTMVRGDGLHFCPIAGVFPCPVHSSGALRFSLAISNAANNPADFD